MRTEIITEIMKLVHPATSVYQNFLYMFDFPKGVRMV